MPIIRLEKLLKSSPGGRLDKIVQTAQDFQDLTTRLQQSLDGDSAAALLSASLRDGDLVLVASSSAFASRLRFEADTLLAAAREHGVTANRCVVRVAR